MTLDDDSAEPLDPAESLALIDRERRNAVRGLAPDPRLMHWPWGFAWLIGFGLFFLRYGPGGRVLVDLPDWLPLLVLLPLMMLAGVVSGAAGARQSRQISGPTSRQARLYAVTWSVAFAGMCLVFSRLTPYVPEQQLWLLWGGGMVAVAGALHMAGGAMWSSRDLFLLGSWTSVINAIGIIAGAGWHPLIVAVGAGGGMIAAGWVGWRRLR